MSKINVADVSVDTAKLGSLTLASMVAVHNALAPEDRRVEKFKSKAEGVRALRPLISQHVRSRARRHRSPPIDRTKKIEIIADGNPKKAGSKAYQRFGFLRSGMTVGEAREAGVTAEDIRYGVDKKEIRIRD